MILSAGSVLIFLVFLHRVDCKGQHAAPNAPGGVAMTPPEPIQLTEAQPSIGLRQSSEASVPATVCAQVILR